MLILADKEKKILKQANAIFEKFSTYNAVEMTSPTLVINYLRGKIGFCDVEHFLVLYLNNQNHLIESVIESTGTIDAASVYPRNIAKRALELGACSVVLSHNHPSGICKPSQADRNITKKLQEGLRFLDINVLDHVIVSGGDSYSFAEMGEM